MRTIFYGDIHGCLEEFKELRAKLKITQGDREISLGDILDRGFESNAALKYVRENSIELVLGNHEYKYIRYKKHEQTKKESGKKNPMHFTDEELNIFHQLNLEDFIFLENAPFLIKIDNITALHGGISNKIKLKNATKKELESLTRIRRLDENQKILSIDEVCENSRFWSEVYEGGEGVIVYGHQAFEEVKIDKYSFGIDTACVYGNRLSALLIHDTKEPMQNYELVDVSATPATTLKNSLQR